MFWLPPLIDTSVPVALVIAPPLAVKVPVVSPVIWMPLPVLLADDTVEKVAPPPPRLMLVRSTAAPPLAVIVLPLPPTVMVDWLGLAAPLPFRPKPPSAVTARLEKPNMLVLPRLVEKSMPLPLWPLPIALSVTVVAPKLKLALAAVVPIWITVVSALVMLVAPVTVKLPPSVVTPVPVS